MMKHAVEIGLRGEDPTRDVKAIRVKSDGIIAGPMTRSRNSRGDTLSARALGWRSHCLYTGQRRSDVVRMGRQHIHDGVLRRQHKTGVVMIPVHPALAAMIAETPADHLTFLVTQFGQPFNGAGFGNWFRERCDKPASSTAARTAYGRRQRADWPRPAARNTRSQRSRPRQPARDHSLHQGGRPETARAGGDGEGERGNIHCQTCREV